MRWTKLWRDIRAESGRGLIMLAAIGFALFAVMTMLGAFGIVTREVGVNYMSTNPAHATIDIGAVTPDLLEFARNFPGVAEAEPRAMIEARVKVGDEWMRMLLSIVDDFDDLRMNRFKPVSGAWPPPAGTMLLERMAVDVIGADEGDVVTIRTKSGKTAEMPVTGLVHDTTLAPAWQEQSGYGYLSMATYAVLGEPAIFDELRVQFEGAPSQAEIDTKALELAEALQARGVEVHSVKVPPPGQHPHQGQIASALLMFLGLALLALVLAAILVAAVLAASLARQAREIAVMKAVGARTGQIAVMYVGALLALGAAALAVSVPLGAMAAGGLSELMANTMNFLVEDRSIPLWVFAVVVAAGLLTPLLAALPAIVGASRVSVRQALSSTGVASSFGSRATGRSPGFPSLGIGWVLAARNTFRRRGRLLLSLALLATGGSLFITALSARDGWRAVAASAVADRHYDAEFRLAAAASEKQIAEVLQATGVVENHEVWGIAPTAYATEGQIDLMRTYPDRGHGSFSVIGVVPETDLVTLPVIEGRWLSADDTDAVVVTQGHRGGGKAASVGDKITLSLGGRPTTWTLAGIVREIGGGGAYVNKAAFDRLAGDDAAQLVRVVLKQNLATSREVAVASIEDALANAGLAVERAMPVTTLYLALVGHVEVPVTMLVAASVLLALIGGLGLASMMTVNVLERTREIGVMKAIGATPSRVVKIVVGEALVTAGLSWLAALAVAVPLIALIGLSGLVMFGTPLPFVVSAFGAALWLGIVVTIALVASLVPAWRAARLVVREALAYT